MPLLSNCLSRSVQYVLSAASLRICMHKYTTYCKFTRSAWLGAAKYIHLVIQVSRGGVFPLSHVTTAREGYLRLSAVCWSLVYLLSVRSPTGIIFIHIACIFRSYRPPFFTGKHTSFIHVAPPDVFATRSNLAACLSAFL